MTSVWAVMYCLFAYMSVRSIGEVSSMVTMDVPIGELTVASLLAGISFGFMVMERLMPSEKEFDEAAKQRGYVKENDNG
jgi:hypothetical protein